MRNGTPAQTIQFNIRIIFSVMPNFVGYDWWGITFMCCPKEFFMGIAALKTL